jgi:hypothetical protein
MVGRGMDRTEPCVVRNFQNAEIGKPSRRNRDGNFKFPRHGGRQVVQSHDFIIVPVVNPVIPNPGSRGGQPHRMAVHGVGGLAGGCRIAGSEEAQVVGGGRIQAGKTQGLGQTRSIDVEVIFRRGLDGKVAQQSEGRAVGAEQPAVGPTIGQPTGRNHFHRHRSGHAADGHQVDGLGSAGHYIVRRAAGQVVPIVSVAIGIAGGTTIDPVMPPEVDQHLGGLGYGKLSIAVGDPVQGTGISPVRIGDGVNAPRQPGYRIAQRKSARASSHGGVLCHPVNGHPAPCFRSQPPRRPPRRPHRSG